METALQDPSTELSQGTARPVISIEGVHKYYDLGETKVHALRGIDLEIAPGEFVAIMGSSGSGKSTLMNLLGCLDKPSSGRYLLDGIDVSNLDKKTLAGIRNRKLGFVFQSFNLLSALSALENVQVALNLHGASNLKARTRASEPVTSSSASSYTCTGAARSSNATFCRASL